MKMKKHVCGNQILFPQTCFCAALYSKEVACGIFVKQDGLSMPEVQKKEFSLSLDA